jgi:hypothetical protein
MKPTLAWGAGFNPPLRSARLSAERQRFERGDRW